MTLHRFAVTGAVSPDLPLRVLNLFAQQAIAVEEVTIVQHGERYEIAVSVAGLAEQQAAIIAAKLQAMVTVERATLAIA